ncbi:UNVERIFIED_CONTAM: hypothetical protein FKN15_002786 [Acipenser sinensis]
MPGQKSPKEAEERRRQRVLHQCAFLGEYRRLGQTSEEFLLDLAEKVRGAYPDSPIQDHLKLLSKQFLLGMTPQELNVRLTEDPKLTLLGALKVVDEWGCGDRRSRGAQTGSGMRSSRRSCISVHKRNATLRSNGVNPFRSIY